MSAFKPLSIDATITARGQTTVPSAIRKVLGVDRGTITFRTMPDGSVLITPKAADAHDDPVLGAFLEFLEKDIASGNVVRLQTSIVDEIDELIGDADIDLDAPLADD